MVIRRWILCGILITWVGYFPAWRYSKVETNLGSSTELSWNENCGLHPVKTGRWNGPGVGTDRDISIAPGARNRLPGDVTVAEVMSGGLYSCPPSDDTHVAVQIDQSRQVQRLPVIAKNGTLADVISTDDLPLRAELTDLGRQPEISTDEAVSLLVARQ